MCMISKFLLANAWTPTYSSLGHGGTVVPATGEPADGWGGVQGFMSTACQEPTWSFKKLLSWHFMPTDVSLTQMDFDVYCIRVLCCFRLWHVLVDKNGLFSSFQSSPRWDLSHLYGWMLCGLNMLPPDTHVMFLVGYIMICSQASQSWQMETLCLNQMNTSVPVCYQVPPFRFGNW